ncbi:MAG TPA: hypothetical protein VGJ13_17960 [Pseudonocardiaceae bacterium]
MSDPRDLDQQVLGWLSADDRDPASVSRYAVQELAWHTAPRKWIMPPGELPEVAAACARLLEASGRDRAAAVLREGTPAVLASWAHSPQAGFAAFTRAMQATGVEPPDTPTLDWAQHLGSDEATVLDAARRMLEAAIDAGAFVPGARSWRTTQRNLVDAWLRAPSTLFSGRAPIDVVHAERAADWVEAGSAARRMILRGLVPLPVTRTGREPHPVEPVRFLLDAIHEGVPLTKTGRLPPALVREAAVRFGWGLPAFTIRKESDVAEVAELRDLATRARLITVRRRQLTLTPTGRAAREDHALLWRATTAGWFDQDDFAAHIAEVAAAILLEAPAGSEALTSATHEAIAPSFRNTVGAHPDLRDVRIALWDWLRPGHALGWLADLRGMSGQLHQLTGPGRAAALEGLRHRARSPSHTAGSHPAGSHPAG